jgi:hypothetical protein
MKLALFLAVAAFAGCAGKTSSDTLKNNEPDDDETIGAETGPADTATLLKRLGDAADCSQDDIRGWCAAANFDDGSAPTLTGSHLFLGATVPVIKDVPVKDTLAKAVSLSVMAVEADADRALVTDIPAESDAEKKIVADVRDDVVSQLDGRGGPPKVPASLAHFLQQVPAAHVIEKSAKEWVIKGQSPAQLRSVGKFLVVVETPADGQGIFVSVYRAP